LTWWPLNTPPGINGTTHLAITKLDVLSGLEEIKVLRCLRLRWKKGPKNIRSTRTFCLLQSRFYKTFKGFSQDMSEVETVEDLPQGARDYVKFIEDQNGCTCDHLGRWT